MLLPRLGDFQAAHPDIDVRVAADNRVIDIDRESVDIAIRYSLRDTVPDGAAWMFGESVVPVAHPTLDVRGLDARELQRHVLLEFDDPSRPWLQWSEWLSARGLSRVRPRHACCASTSTTRSCTRPWPATASRWAAWR